MTTTGSAPTGPVERTVDVAVVGGGQSGLAVGYHLRRAGLEPGRDVVVVDAGGGPGGAWPRTWSSLRLFSPAAYSSLPGRMMPRARRADGGSRLPTRDEVVAYLADYEQRYDLRPLRPHRVTSVRDPRGPGHDPDGPLLVEADDLRLEARVVVSATGTWDQPFWPVVPGAATFTGRQLHAADHRSPEEYAGQRVVVVGGGNSGAQLLAELSLVADTTWVTLRPPSFLPDDVDGRVLFDAATARVRAASTGGAPGDGPGLDGDVVVVPEVRAARERGVMVARPMFDRMTPTGVAWDDGTELAADVVLWCTGFRPALRHLAPLHLRDGTGRILLDGASGTRSVVDPRVHLVGYGDWTGPARPP